jgi:hypothetical protein
MRWPHERRHARRWVDHALMSEEGVPQTPGTSPSANPRAINGAATNETARVRWPDRARSIGASVLNQPHEADGSNPSWFLRFDRWKSQSGLASGWKRQPHRSAPANVSVKRTESSDRHSLSDGCCSRGGRARYGSTGGAIETGATRHLRTRFRPAIQAAVRSLPDVWV